MQGIPQLSNNWGSMIMLLDAVLVTGFNFKPIVSISKSSADAITATINLGAGHGFIDRQVIRISGSTNGWNGDFKVLSANTNDIIIECLPSHPSSIMGVAACSTAPLDFEIVFSTSPESTEPKRAYRSTDPDSLGLILLVHDFCVAGAAVNGAKFAKVGVVAGMSDIDSIIGAQMPFNINNPNANWGWDGTYHGWAKWYYAHQEDYSYFQTYDFNSPSNYNRNFRIVGDNSSIAMLTHDGFLYGFLEFEDVFLGGRNCTLYASGLNTARGIGQGVGVYSQSRGAFGNSTNTNGNSFSKAHIWYDESGVVNPKQAGCQVFLSLIRSDAGTFSTAPNNGVSSNTRSFVQAPIFDSVQNLRGVLPFFRLCTKKDNYEAATGSGIVYSRYYYEYSEYWFGLNLEER